MKLNNSLTFSFFQQSSVLMAKSTRNVVQPVHKLAKNQLCMTVKITCALMDATVQTEQFWRTATALHKKNVRAQLEAESSNPEEPFVKIATNGRLTAKAVN